MKPKVSEGRERRDSSSIFVYVKIFFLYPALMLLACFSLLPLIAMEILRRVVGGAIGGLLAGLGTLAALSVSLLTLIALAAWFVFRGEWGQLFCMLPEMLEWLRSAGLLA